MRELLIVATEYAVMIIDAMALVVIVYAAVQAFQGTVFQKDLGPRTERLASRMTEYSRIPWKKVTVSGFRTMKKARHSVTPAR